MAFATGHKTLTVTLNLDELEARWLKGIMQNPLDDQTIHEESHTDKTMRKTFFDALVEAGVDR